MPYTLSSEDIFQFLIRDEVVMEVFGGVLPIDKLPAKINREAVFVINTDPAVLPGEHWVCIFCPHKSPPEFFDSLGRDPTFYSHNLPKFLGEKYMFNTIRLQPHDSSTCGLYCLYYIHHRIRGVDFLDILKMFSKNLEHNDDIVINFYQKN